MVTRHGECCGEHTSCYARDFRRRGRLDGVTLKQVFTAMHLLFERAAALRAMFCFNLFQAPTSNSIHVDSVSSSSDPAPRQHHVSMRSISAPPLASHYLESTNNDFHDDNDTVFGDILRGNRPARILGETKDLLAFQDRHPRARLHALVIPKRFIPSVFDLQTEKNNESNSNEDKTITMNDDSMLLQEMESMALSLLEKYEPQTLATGDYILCFHVPPFNSVDHLHLHVLAPKSEMSFLHSWIKYNTQTRWCTSLESVQRRLAEGKSAVPFRRP
jgi:diadenosine tetraphosphate (Ap4A) HIT family hydrolase